MTFCHWICQWFLFIFLVLTKVDSPEVTSWSELFRGQYCITSDADNPATSLRNSHLLALSGSKKELLFILLKKNCFHSENDNFTVISLFKETSGANTKRLPAENPAERERSSEAERGCEDS